MAAKAAAGPAVSQHNLSGRGGSEWGVVCLTTGAVAGGSRFPKKRPQWLEGGKEREVGKEN